MTAVRVLHVDDEPDIREVVELSLGLDSYFATQSCGSGKEALAVAAEWQPDFILLDVMMPIMDGPATLVHLREDSTTANIPVIFMTARAQAREVDRFRSLGAIGVIAKPFDPMTLAAALRNYVQPVRDPMEELRAAFLQRIKRDAAALSQEHLALKEENRLPATLNRIKRIAHGLAGAGGIYGFVDLSDAAAVLEDTVTAELDDGNSPEATDLAFARLISHVASYANTANEAARLLQNQ
jgi:two-component system OmpR family response regulator